MESCFSYLKADIKRCIHGKEFWVGNLCCFLILYFSGLSYIKYEVSVWSLLNIVTATMPFLLLLSFASMTYSDCFCADVENKYVQQMLMRGKLWSYVLAKTIVIQLSTMLTVFISTVAYIFYLRVKLPWFYEGEKEELGLHRYTSMADMPFLYVIAEILKFAVLAGILGILAAYISLYIRNRLLLLTVPLMVYYFAMYYTGGLKGDFVIFRMELVYIPFCGDLIWEYAYQSYLWAMAIAAILAVVLNIAIIKKIRKDLGER